MRTPSGAGPPRRGARWHRWESSRGASPSASGADRFPPAGACSAPWNEFVSLVTLVRIVTHRGGGPTTAENGSEERMMKRDLLCDFEPDPLAVEDSLAGGGVGSHHHARSAGDGLR